MTENNAPSSGLTWRDLVTQVAALYGTKVTDDEADTILWNFTGYPAFFYGDPAKCATRQVNEFFATNLKMKRRSQLCRACADCACPEAKKSITTRAPIAPRPMVDITSEAFTSIAKEES